MTTEELILQSVKIRIFDLCNVIMQVIINKKKHYINECRSNKQGLAYILRPTKDKVFEMNFVFSKISK